MSIKNIITCAKIIIMRAKCQRRRRRRKERGRGDGRRGEGEGREGGGGECIWSAVCPHEMQGGLGDSQGTDCCPTDVPKSELVAG